MTPLNIRSLIRPRLLRRRRRGRRGSVSVELALVVSLFLLPLSLGCTDALYLLVVRYQINQALQSIYLFAWANPTDATNTDSINAVLAEASQSALTSMTLASAPTTSQTCLQTSGSSTATSNGACSSGTLQTSATYSVTANIILPFAFLVFNHNYPMTITGTVQYQ